MDQPPCKSFRLPLGSFLAHEDTVEYTPAAVDRVNGDWTKPFLDAVLQFFSVTPVHERAHLNCVNPAGRAWSHTQDMQSHQGC